MKDKRISIRLNMDRYSHRKAYEVYESIAKRERSDFIRLAIILMNDRDEIINWIKEILADHNVKLSIAQNNIPLNVEGEDVSESATNMLNFISNLNAKK